MVAEADGLGPLQMGVAGHDAGFMGRRLIVQGGDQLSQQRLQLHGLVSQVKSQVQGHLVVAASGGVQLLARVADALCQLLLHEHVDILAARIDGQRAALQILQDGQQPFHQLRLLRLADDAAGGEHFRMGDAAGDILFVHAAVKANGGIEIIRDLIGYAGVKPGPHLCHSADPLLRKSYFLPSTRA